MALTPDDSYGRDAWEFTWRILGTDMVYQTVRFPHTRPTITLRDSHTEEFREYPTDALKLMGDAYAHYDANGGVKCYVVEAIAREDWLPNYYVPRLIFWLDTHSFFPLRVEQYGPDGKLIHIEVRMADLFNPALGNLGYGTRFIVHWHIPPDIMSYLSNDSHKVIQWDAREAEIYFNPDFLRRQWYLDTSIKTQAEVRYPEEFFLRPSLWPDKFPDQRADPPVVRHAGQAARPECDQAAGLSGRNPARSGNGRDPRLLRPVRRSAQRRPGDGALHPESGRPALTFPLRVGGRMPS